MKQGDRVVLKMYPVYGLSGTISEKIEHPELVDNYWLVKLDMPTLQEGSTFDTVAIAERNMALQDFGGLNAN